MGNDDKEKVEVLPAGVVVMMLEGLREANDRQQQTINYLVAGWVFTIVCFAVWCIISR